MWTVRYTHANVRTVPYPQSTDTHAQDLYMGVLEPGKAGEIITNPSQASTNDTQVKNTTDQFLNLNSSSSNTTSTTSQQEPSQMASNANRVEKDLIEEIDDEEL